MLHTRPPLSGPEAASVAGADAIPRAAASRASGTSVQATSPNLLKLVLWMSGTLTAFIVAALSVRALQDTLNAFEMMTIRSTGGLVILCALGALRPSLWSGVRRHRMRLQGLRNVAHFGSQICWNLAITMLPFATVFALEFTIPAWVTLLAVLFLGERMSARRALALTACVAGVVVILRPGHETFQPAALIMLAGALLFAIAAIATKKLITTETTFSIMLWMNLMQLPLNFLGSDPAFVFKIDTSLALPLIGIASAGLAIHYCLANAFRYGDAMIVIPMDFLRVPLIALIGWIFYGEHIDVFVFAGAGLIVAGVLWNVRAEAQRSHKVANAPAAVRPSIQPAE